MGPIFDEYDDMSSIANAANSRKVFVNLGEDDLDKEYQRIYDLGIGTNVTPIRYLNVFSPYWYFANTKKELHLKYPVDIEKMKKQF